MATGLVLCAVRHADTNVEVSDEHVWIDITVHCRVCFDDVLEVLIDKVVVRVGMLLDETFDLEESREKVPFVLYRSVLVFYQVAERRTVAVLIGSVKLFP